MTRKEVKRILEETYSHWLRLKRENLLPDDECVKVAEAIDLAIEALKDRPQGEWIAHATTVGDKEYIEYSRCSECGEMALVRMNYCPNCGADMRGEEE